MNRQTVLNLLRTHGSATRPQLAELSGLSSMAISRQVQTLLSDGLIREIEQGQSTGGRPPGILEITPEGFIVAGIKLTPAEIQCVLVDSHGTVVTSETRSRDGNADPVTTINEARTLAQALAERQLSVPRLSGIGIGLPGIIDWRKGVCVEAPTLGWRDVKVGDILSRASSLAIAVDNDVNSFAVAENLFGVGRTCQDFAVVTLGLGVGSALISDGRLYRGWMGGAGELGHSNVALDGRACTCGNRGCLEAYLGDSQLQQQIAEQGSRALLTDLAVPTARERDPALATVYRSAVVHLGIAIAHLVNIVNPQRIVFGGESVLLTRDFAADVEAAASAWIFPGLRGSVSVQLSKWAHQPTLWARGAASLVMEQHFSGVRF